MAKKPHFIEEYRVYDLKVLLEKFLKEYKVIFTHFYFQVSKYHNGNYYLQIAIYNNEESETLTTHSIKLMEEEIKKYSLSKSK